MTSTAFACYGMYEHVQYCNGQDNSCCWTLPCLQVVEYAHIVWSWNFEFQCVWCMCGHPQLVWEWTFKHTDTTYVCHTAAGRVNSIEVELGSWTGSRFPRDSPHYFFIEGGKFPRVLGEAGGNVHSLFKKNFKKKRKKTPDTCVAGSLMCCYKLIHMSAKQSELGSKWPSKFRGPKQERCRNCMKPCSVRSLFHYV